MEKGPSEYAKYWTSPENEVEHFKHASQFDLNPYEYSKKAVEFLNDDDPSIQEFITKDGTRSIEKTDFSDLVFKRE